MTREEAKQTILIKSKSYESAHQNYIHLLSLHKIIDDIFDEHEEIIKSERKKARSIVAMLFWKMKRQKKVFQKYYEAYGHNNYLTNCYRGMFEQALMDFNKSRKMLKDTK